MHHCHACNDSIKGVVMSLESPEYTVYEEDQFVEICIQHTHGIIRVVIPVTLTTIMITAGMCAFCYKY